MHRPIEKALCILITLLGLVLSRCLSANTADELVALDLKTGQKKWSVNCCGDSGSRTRTAVAYSASALTYYDSILFHCRPSKGRTVSLLALDAGSGKELWKRDAGTIAYHTSPDILVNRDLVWTLNTTAWTYEGLEPTTGEKKKALDVSLVSKGTHHNCYRNRATRDFFLYGRNKGIEYFDIDHNVAKRVNWIKGACRYGNMPANGMIYFPSHFCTCYATSKMNGMLAIGHTGITAAKPSTSDQVTRGIASGRELSAVSGEDDWPTYRQNIARTGFQPVPLSGELRTKWTSKVGGALTPPVIADQKVFVASKDDHRVVCLDAATGNVQWTFLPEGKVDSPPSFYRGRLVFGARDGSVYCLDAQSGELAWRFRAAPEDKQMGAFEQLESVWPVFGSLPRNKGKRGRVGAPLWTAPLPIKAKSLLVGRDNLYLAGVRDRVDAEDPWAHFDGRMGGLITIHSKKDGKLKGEIELVSPAVFDGLASAGKKLFVSCSDGSVLCFE